MKKKLFVIFLALAAAVCLAFGLAACNGDDPGQGGYSADGIYYLYQNGSVDKSQYIKLEGGNWTDDDGDGGRVEISGNSITLYVEIFGEQEELADGTVKDGVLTINMMGAEIVYCKDGSTPSDGPGELPAETYVVTYDANGGEFADGNTTFEQSEVPENSLLTSPDSPMRANWTFSGWATDRSGNYIWNFATDVVTQDITLYAVWHQQSAAILSVDGASIDGTNIFMLVDENTESVSLANKVVCSEDSIWRLYYDRLGQTEIPTRIAAGLNGTLNNGENVFYIVVTSANGSQVNVYELVIHRSYAVSVNYYDNKNNLLDAITVYTGDEFVASYAPDIAGYTFNGWKDVYGAPFTSDTLWSSLSLYADCTAKTYTVTLDVNEGNALSDTQRTVTYDKAYTFTVPKRTGHTFLGWYIGATQLTDKNGKSIAVWNRASDATVTAKWQANDYTVTLRTNDASAGTVAGGGDHKYGSSVTITAKTNSGYTWLGWYNKDGELVTDSLSYNFTMGFDVTYTAKWTYYTVTTAKNDGAAGTVTNYSDTKITAGNTVTITATTYLGYDWSGWYDGDTLVTKELSYSFVMPEQNLSFTAKWEMQPELAPFTFSSTTSTLKINGIKDSTVTQIVVPDHVTGISQGAFGDCTSLTSITLPFVGAQKGGTENTHFGYIFGAWYYFNNGDYVPTSLKEVIITGGDSIGGSAFYDCSSLTSITIPDGVTSIDYYAFYNCDSLETVYYAGSEEDWQKVDIGSYNYSLTGAEIIYNYGS